MHCSLLAALNNFYVSSIDTLTACTRLTALDLTWNTKLVDIVVLTACTALTSRILCNCHWVSVASMAAVFSYMSGLRLLDVSQFCFSRTCVRGSVLAAYVSESQLLWFVGRCWAGFMLDFDQPARLHLAG